jgi:hypothetical protein
MSLKKKLDLFQFTQEGTLFLTVRGGEIGYAKGPIDSVGMPREPLVALYDHKYVLEELKLEIDDAQLLDEISDLIDRQERWWHQLTPSVQKWLLTDVSWNNGKATATWFGPRPICCGEAKHLMEDTSYAASPRPFIYLQQRFDSNAPSCHSGPVLWWCGSRIITCCPFCGQQLPELESDLQPTGPIHRTLDGYYCDTCKERNHGCQCRPPTANYKLKI